MKNAMVALEMKFGWKEDSMVSVPELTVKKTLGSVHPCESQRANCPVPNGVAEPVTANCSSRTPAPVPPVIVRSSLKCAVVSARTEKPFARGPGTFRLTMLPKIQEERGGWRKPVGVEPTSDTKYRTTGLKPAPSTDQEWLP